ncbi:MAG TPA: FAD-binding oxidoreductase [Gemmatimonadaceae bacterium]|nr:FAD-binding oxidoreductase [Gemmatimonadaceae bacterium]
MKRRTFLQSAVAAAAVASLPRRQAFATIVKRPLRLPVDVEAVTGDGERVVLTTKALEDLKAMLRGKLILAGESGYDEARTLLNPSFDKKPAVVIQPTGVADIRTAVNFARENKGLLVAVKCGGHSVSGQSTCDKGMLIDLSLFRDVRVDPIARRAWVTGGSLLGQVDHEAMAHGLVTPLGTVSHTGVGGLVTGGGFGRVARRFGLSIDNLVSVHVVTADGELRRASATENPDLFWGVRGGGGNFGIVTSFEFRLHPMQRTVVAGDIVYPISKAKEVLSLYSEYLHTMPEELDLGAIVAHPPGGEPGAALFHLCYSGAESNAERVLAPLLKLGTPVANSVKAMDYVAVQRSGDVTDRRAQTSYLKSGFIPKFPADLVTAIMEGFEAHPARSAAVFFQNGGGAIAKVPPGATAFAQRDTLANMLCGVNWKFGEDGSAHVAWIKQYWQPLEKFTTGFYVNDTGDRNQQEVQANYRRNHERLVAAKNKYDPKNLFRLNANVKPTAVAKA